MRSLAVLLLTACTAAPPMSTNSAPTSPLAGATMVGFVATTDAARCRRFYEGQLGFRVVHQDDLATTFDAVGQPLRVQRLATHTPQRFTVLGWNVADLDAVLARLEGAGIRVKAYGLPMQDARGVASFGDGTRLVWLEDPDGNILSIAQMPRP
jgi:catechol 2,3-dioxygenase-like lactoylglutathione lyase family enzyme